jgi:diketogulonate reductase-like aldo/keto reductase
MANRGDSDRALPRGRKISRRTALKLAAAGASLVALPRAFAATRMLERPIPRTGETIPALGLGTWQTFDVDAAATRDWAAISEVLSRFFAAGGRVIDSSPMYGKAEATVGSLLAAIRGKNKRARGVAPFLATKVWTQGREQGKEQMSASMRKLGAARVDLMQVHNLMDWKTHLATLRAWKEQGKVRYIGVTHHATSAFDELEAIIAREKIDFVQLPYSIAMRTAEKRLLPAAGEHGVAVLVMRPFGGGSLFGRVRGKKLPPWASEFDCTSWAQFFLKFILGHRHVTCPIPATRNPEHLSDNMRAGLGRLPDDALRARMIRYL